VQVDNIHVRVKFGFKRQIYFSWKGVFFWLCLVCIAPNVLITNELERIWKERSRPNGDTVPESAWM
jgi:hypothetical protein